MVDDSWTQRWHCPMLGHRKWPSPLPAKREAVLGPKRGRNSLVTLGTRKELWFQSCQPNTRCLAPRQVQALRSVAASVKCKDTERHKRSVPSFNKESKIRLYPAPRCETPCSCVRSVEATQIFLLPQLDAVQLWHFKDLMLGSQSCQRLCLLF